MKGINQFKEFMIFFLFGSTIYGLIELGFRNRTHWTMIIAGGIVFYEISVIERLFSKHHLFFKCFLGALFVTAIELISGIIINKIFKLNVWDYSKQPLNLFGQICPVFSFIWFLICIPANILCTEIKSFLNKKLG